MQVTKNSVITLTKAPRYHRLTKCNVGDKELRDNILTKAKALKNMSDPWNRVYVKKDIHPVMLEENKRLRSKAYELKQCIENREKEIRIIRETLCR